MRMSAEIISLFSVRPEAEFTLRPIGIDEWSDRLVRDSVKWLAHRRSDALAFLTVAGRFSGSTIIVEFDGNGRNPEVVSASILSTAGWISELILQSVLPTLSFGDEPRGLALSSRSLQEPMQFLVLPLPTGGQKFAAVVF